MFRAGAASGWVVSQNHSGANMSVDVSIGGGLINTSANVPYFGWNDAIENVTVSTSNPTNARIDTIVAYIDLSLITTATTNNLNALKFMVVAGTTGPATAPTTSAIQTAIGAGNPYVPGPNIAVAAAASSIITANVSGAFLPMALASGYLWGGASNTKGHLVPNTADDVLALLGAAQTFTGAQTFGGAVTVGGVNIAGAWSSWSPTYSANGAMTYTGVTTNSARYMQIGKTIFFTLDATGTIGGTANSQLKFTAPVARQASTSGASVGYGKVDNAAAEIAEVTWDAASTTVIAVSRPSLVNYVAGGGNLHISGFYEAA